MKRTKKRILSLLLATVVTLGIFPASTFAADTTIALSECQISWDHILTDADGNAFQSGYGLRAEDNPFGYALLPIVREMHDYTAKRNGLTDDKSKWIYGKDYVYCFCIEHGILLSNPTEYVGSGDDMYGDKYKQLSMEQKDLLSLALAYGYPNRTDLETSKDANACYSATQLIVWQITLGFRTSPTELDDKTYPADGFSGTMTEQLCRNKYFKDYYDRILSDIAEHYKRPSFTGTLQSSAPVYEMDFESGRYTITLTDTNNVLSDFYVSSNGGVTASISGDKLTLSSSQPITDEVLIKLNRKMPSTNNTTSFLIWSVPGKEADNQDLVSGVPANNDPVPAFLKAKAPYGDIKLIKISEDGKIGNIPFHISGNGIEQDIRTQSDGTFLLENLRPGIYEVTEQTENKYEPQKTRRVTVVSGQTAAVTFSNVLKRGALEVVKTSEDQFVEGITFRLYGTSLSGLPVDEYATTDSSGVATFEDVLISGSTPYTLEEVGVEDKYVVPKAQQAVIEWNKVTHKSFDNVLKKWRATLTKSDSETGTAQGDASLENAKYGVFKDGQLVDSYYTGPMGDFTTDWYNCGEGWTIRELEPSEGYLLNPEVYDVGAEPELYELEYNEVAVDANEDILKGRVALIKHTDDGSTQIETPEEGAEFQMFLRSTGSYEAAKETERDILICDEFGYAESKDVPYGWYTIHQTKGWDGREFIKDFDVYISEDGAVYRYLINNANFESRVMVVKKDAETGNTVPLAGHGYKLYDPQGNPITMTITYPEVVEIDTFYTDSSGYLITPESLPYGEGYSLVEVQTVEPYVLDSTPVYFDITQENSEEHNGVTVVVVEKPNMPQKGTISLYKDGEVFSSVTTSGGGDSPLLYQPVYDKTGLEGGVYDVVATEDVVSGGVLRYHKGDTVATLTTGPDGWATSEPLYLSTYQIFERKAPYGMVLNPEPITVTLSYAGQHVQLTTAEAHITNERQKVEITLDKVLEQDERFRLGMNGEILHVAWGLYAAEPLTAADGSTIPADGLLEIVYCDESGKAAFTTDVPMDSKLYVKEYTTDSHYLISDQKYPVVFDYQGQDTTVVHIRVNDGDPIENELIRGDIYGLKVSEDGEGVAGAVFGLFAPDETEFTKETALMTDESGESGEFSFLGVPLQNFIVKEIQPAPAFVPNHTLYPVTVTEDGATIEIEVENRHITGSVQATKVDAEYPDNKLTGAVFEIYMDMDGNKEFDADIDLLVGEMTEVEIGVYRMEDLRYNGFFLYEKISPEGFLKDDTYHYFEIREDGQTVIVENEAGVGFINQPITGELELTKTDITDGTPLPNVGFRIRNEQGDIIAEGYTDEQGIAKFSLRYGKYTYQEFESLDGYEIDDKEYPFEIREDGEIIKASVTNKKIPVTPPPQTGDNTQLGLWIALAGASGASLLLMAVRRRRHAK